MAGVNNDLADFQSQGANQGTLAVTVRFSLANLVESLLLGRGIHLRQAHARTVIAADHSRRVYRDGRKKLRRAGAIALTRLAHSSMKGNLQPKRVGDKVDGIFQIGRASCRDRE